MAAGVKALSPSLCRDTATKALECPLEKNFDFKAETRKIIVKLNNICLKNVVTVETNAKNDVLTNYNRPVSLANIAVHCILRPIAGVLNGGRSFAQIYRWHNIDLCIRKVKRTRLTSTTSSIRKQWLGPNVSTSLHSRKRRANWNSWNLTIA